MNIDIKMQKNILIATLNGEVDHHYSKIIKARIEEEYNTLKAKNIVISFKNVRFMDSSGIGVIIGRYKFAKSRGGTLVACDLTMEVKRIFDISGLTKIINVYDNIEEAVKSIEENV